jgi:YD repeat-containing protein
VRYEVRYRHDPDAYWFRVESVQAFDSHNRRMRERRAQYGSRGELERITNVLVGGRHPTTGAVNSGIAATNPVWRYEHDEFGTLKEVRDPTGMVLEYG